MVGARRHRRQRAQGGLARAVEHEVRHLVEVGDAELVEHGTEAPAADLVAGGQAVEVADDVVRRAHVVAHDVDEVAVQPAPVGPAHDGDPQPLLVDLAGVGTPAPAAHVDHVGGGGEEADEVVAGEHGCRDGEVVQVTGALPGIVGDVDVARRDALGPYVG